MLDNYDKQGEENVKVKWNRTDLENNSQGPDKLNNQAPKHSPSWNRIHHEHVENMLLTKT